MNKLHEELQEAIKIRDDRTFKGAIVGAVLGFLLCIDFVGCVLGAIIGGVLMYNANSGEVTRIKKIQELSK